MWCRSEQRGRRGGENEERMVGSRRAAAGWLLAEVIDIETRSSLCGTQLVVLTP